jgi:hypothetical protein
LWQKVLQNKEYYMAEIHPKSLQKSASMLLKSEQNCSIFGCSFLVNKNQTFVIPFSPENGPDQLGFSLIFHSKEWQNFTLFTQFFNHKNANNNWAVDHIFLASLYLKIIICPLCQCGMK